jgi:hypothetical protein
MSDLQFEPGSFAFWTSFLASVWCPKRHHEIDLILDAGRVRENWMEGDVYIHARTCEQLRLPFFYCNYSPRGYGGSVDWSYWDSDDAECDDPDKGARPLMLAEIKVLGGDYFHKTFAGEDFDLKYFIEGTKGGTCIRPGHWALSQAKLGGLVEDYCRLVRYTRHPCLRMMVLVLDTRRQDTLLGRCLEQVEFEKPGKVVIKSANWLCKAWEITGALCGPAGEF